MVDGATSSRVAARLTLPSLASTAACMASLSTSHSGLMSLCFGVLSTGVLLAGAVIELHYGSINDLYRDIVTD